MKKTVIFLILFCGITFAQNTEDSYKPKIVVYVTGDLLSGENKALATEILHALVKNGRYIAVERSNEFLAKVAEEHIKQRNGSVDETQISEMGKQFGAQIICIADITKVFDSYLVSARIIDIETSAVNATGKAYSQLKNAEHFADVSLKVVASMFGWKMEK